MKKHMTEFSELKGKVVKDVTVNVDMNDDGDSILFECEDGTKYELCHSQECCESVTIDNIDGDLKSLIGNQIVMAEDIHNNDDGPKDEEYDESYTWSFYKLATSKGYVTIRWYGASSGYYSETADLYRIEERED